MADKYEDLADAISSESGVTSGDAWSVLCWLDRNPDQVPGRTITESELDRIALSVASYEGPNLAGHLQRHLGYLSITVVPDPEPTNADRWDELLHKAATGAMSSSTLRSLAENLADQGIKAPEAGGDDEH